MFSSFVLRYYFDKIQWVPCRFLLYIIVVFAWIFLIGIVYLTCTEIMPLFTIEPYVVAADLITAWKFAWRQIWKKEETQPVQVHLRKDSTWLMVDDDNIPLCHTILSFVLWIKALKILIIGSINEYCIKTDFF